MPITPSDIEHKTFSTALRGYDLDEVDDFLDEIVVVLRDLHGELTAAKAKIAELEQSKGTGEGGGDEASVGRVLILAQQAADRTVEEARTEADRLLEDARAEADRTLSEARTEAESFEADREQRREAATTEMAELSVLVVSVRNQLALLATTVADKLDEMDTTIDSADLGTTTEDVGDPDADSEVDASLEVNGVDHPSLELTGDDAIADEFAEAGSEVEESGELDLDTIQIDEIAEDQDIDLDSETEPASGPEAKEGLEDEVDSDEAQDSDASDEEDEEPETSD